MLDEREDSNTEKDDGSIQTTKNLVGLGQRKIILNPPKQKLLEIKKKIMECKRID